MELSLPTNVVFGTVNPNSDSVFFGLSNAKELALARRMQTGGESTGNIATVLGLNRATVYRSLVSVGDE